MMTMTSPRSCGLRAIVLAVVPLLAACDQLLEVEAPSRVQAEDLENAAFAELLVRSAVGDFDCALATYITTVGMVADEFTAVNIYSAEAGDYDRRAVDPARQQYAVTGCGGYGGIYQPLSTAIWQADNALEKLTAFTDAEVDNRQHLIQTAQAYGAYGRTLLGESFCTAAINMSRELTSQEILAQAEQLFGQAIAGPDPALSDFARMGRARVRLNLGDRDGALSDAQAVPAGFLRLARYSDASSRTYNEIYSRNNRVYGVSTEEKWRDAQHMGVLDPRVQTVNTGDLGPNGTDTVWVQQKYLALNSSVPIARWEEAQLIIAEIEGGQVAVDIINMLHDQHGIPHFNSTDPDEILNHVIEERARELFLEGHRFWDIRRFELPFDPPPGTPYPVLGGLYGDMRCFPLPNLERDNNPNIGST
ncbi:MAG: RagB/SusD family nutrient uptake outer membrane protein [Longimicrobiales bacterium]